MVPQQLEFPNSWIYPRKSKKQETGAIWFNCSPQCEKCISKCLQLVVLQCRGFWCHATLGAATREEVRPTRLGADFNDGLALIALGTSCDFTASGLLEKSKMIVFMGTIFLAVFLDQYDSYKFYFIMQKANALLLSPQPDKPTGLQISRTNLPAFAQLAFTSNFSMRREASYLEKHPVSCRATGTSTGSSS